MWYAIMKHYLSRLYESDLSKGIVDDLKLLYGQVSVYFNYNSLDSYTSGGASDHIDHSRFSTKSSDERSIS